MRGSFISPAGDGPAVSRASGAMLPVTSLWSKSVNVNGPGASSLASRSRVVLTTQQPLTFVREADLLARPPFSMRFNEAMVGRLIDTLSRLSLFGLSDVSARQRS